MRKLQKVQRMIVTCKIVAGEWSSKLSGLR